jgi:hypothetical protein
MDAEVMLKLNELCLKGKRRLIGYEAMQAIERVCPGNMFDTATLVSYIFMLTEAEKSAIVVNIMKSLEKEKENEGRDS